ncbi:respiratory nitrate reductase subunit gamma [Thermomicrobium sp. 4228-Ro]|uniref:respiratory nitrate reductase subunit gamma n=1 Tax=Thermomicrobium sp. 4228-Ro TaxID=2993937 RepID=UPI002248F0B2|nr:respiratory nitrate reductase subunit gamma [Thermomicrobium sp. 4228-Ro]MCX2726377.1 respiratory nitrate reductase subunit gamma [Thermomicrobium sp. 4228-Ro]
MRTLDILLFVVFPYLAVALAVLVGLYRYFFDRFSFSSFSSQFLENRALFFGSAPWHYALLIILAAHLAGMFTGIWSRFVAPPSRLYPLEALGAALGLSTVVTLAVLTLRRLVNPRIRKVTTLPDWLLVIVLMAQLSVGVYIALFYRWGSLWYMYTAVPWMISLLKLQPQIQFVTSLPWIIKLHYLGGFLLVAIFPFTRLVHVVVFPITYLWRPYQVVVWNIRRRIAPAR